MFSFSQESVVWYTDATGRAVCRWGAGDTPIVYLAWCILCITVSLQFAPQQILTIRESFIVLVFRSRL